MATELMSSGEIARLAQVRRPVVTNWRRRYPHFPMPVAGGDGQLLFPAEPVVTWLLDTGLGNADPDTLRAERTMHTLVAHARQFGGRRTVLALGAALCLRHLSARRLPADPMPLAHRLDADDEFLLSDLGQAPAFPDLPETVEQLIEGAYDAARAHQFLLDSAARLGWPELGADGLNPHLLALIRRAADMPRRLGDGGNMTVADLYAGGGDLLATLMTDQDSPRLSFNAVEPDPALTRLIRRRLLLASVPEFNIEVRPDALNDEFANAAVIVTRLPYQPTEARDTLEDLNRIGDITDLLGSGCTAIVVGPAASLVDPLRERAAIRRRADLLASGLVEAVVRLPGGVYSSRPGHPAALWLLTRNPTPATAGRVLIADLSSVSLDQRLVDMVAEDILLWRAEGHRADGHDPRTGRVVQLRELDLYRGAALAPQGAATATMRARLAADGPALIGEAERRLADAERKTIRYVDEHGSLNADAVRGDGHRPKEVSLGTLRTARRLRELPGHRLSADHIQASGHHRVLGAAEVTSNATRRWIDRLILAAEYPQAVLTEPGDLVVSTVPCWGVMIDENGFSVIEFPAHGLRIVRGDVLTSQVLKALLDVARNTTRSSGAVRGARLRDVTVPDLAPDDARRLDEVLSRIGERERLLQLQARHLAELRELAVTGFADGTVTTSSTVYGTNA